MHVTLSAWEFMGWLLKTNSWCHTLNQNTGSAWLLLFFPTIAFCLLQDPFKFQSFVLLFFILSRWSQPASLKKKNPFIYHLRISCICSMYLDHIHPNSPFWPSTRISKATKTPPSGLLFLTHGVRWCWNVGSPLLVAVLQQVHRCKDHDMSKESVT